MLEILGQEDRNTFVFPEELTEYLSHHSLGLQSVIAAIKKIMWSRLHL